MEQLHNGFTLELCEGAFPFSTDSMALSGFVRLPKNARILDLGSGCGTLGLLLCASDGNCAVTGVEIDESAHQMALQNSKVNGLTNRLTSICEASALSPLTLHPAAFIAACPTPPIFLPGRKAPILLHGTSCNAHWTTCLLQQHGRLNLVVTFILFTSRKDSQSFASALPSIN